MSPLLLVKRNDFIEQYLLKLANHFGLRNGANIIDEVRTAVADWPHIAKAYEIRPDTIKNPNFAPLMPDFTLHSYRELLEALKTLDYEFQTFEQYLTDPKERSIVIRHDVDNRPQNSLETAKIEHEKGIRGTYNFRRN